LTVKGLAISTISQVGGYTYRNESDGELFFFEVLSNWEQLLLENFGNCRDLILEKSLIDVFDQAFEILNKHLVVNGVDLAEEHKSKRLKRKAQRAQRENKYPLKNTPYIGGGNIIEAFVRTLVANRDEEFQIITLPKYEKFWSPDVQSSGWGFDMYAFQFATNRRFIITDNGYIGLGPISCHAGDVVCIMYGCSVPLVLRDDRNTVTLVGEAYIHNLMNGEAMELKENVHFKEKE